MPRPDDSSTVAPRGESGDSLVSDALLPGETLPDYELPDHTDTPRQLSALQGDDPMVLTLLRGAYCPKDRQQLRDLVPFHAKCRVGYVRLVTVTTDSLATLNELRLGVGADWPFLYDEQRILQNDLGIREYTDPEHDPMVPHTLVLEPGLRIAKVYDGYWFWGRPTVDELTRDLRDVSERARFDYDLSAPEVRAAWERGEKHRFYPYDRPEGEALARAAGAIDQFA